MHTVAQLIWRPYAYGQFPTRVGLVAHLVTCTTGPVPGLQPLSGVTSRFEWRQSQSTETVPTAQAQQRVSWRHGCGGLAPTVRGDYRGVRSAENGPDTEVPQPYSALVGSASATENRRQDGEVQTYRPRRPEAPVSQCNHLVHPLEVLKTLRLRADSARECRINRGQHRAARAVGARCAKNNEITS